MFSISDPAREFLKFSTSKWEMLLLPNSFCRHLSTSIPYLVTFGEGFPCNIHYIFLIFFFYFTSKNSAPTTTGNIEEWTHYHVHELDRSNAAQHQIEYV